MERYRWILVNTGITTFNQQVNVNTFNAIGISTFLENIIVSTDPAVTNDASDNDGNFIRFLQTDPHLTLLMDMVVLSLK